MKQAKGNTVGSRQKCTPTDLAYIAGFLDGDGSVMLQLKNRSDTKFGFRCMTTICFYQQTAHAEPLLWIQKILGIGYISNRNDGMTELRISGLNQCEVILTQLKPFIRFKQQQVTAILAAIQLLKQHPLPKLEDKAKRQLIKLILLVQHHNYQSRGKRTKAQLEQLFCLTP